MRNITKDLLRLAVDALPLALIVVDRSGVVRFWNHSAELLFGWKSAEVLGRPNPAVPQDRRDESRAFQELAASGKTLRVKSLRLRKDAALIEVSMTLSPLRNDEGLVVGNVVMCEGIGEPLIYSRKPVDQPGSEPPLAKMQMQKVVPALTPREREIVDGVLSGSSTKEIALRLGTSDQVVRNHLHTIYRQLRVANRAELIAQLSA